jgi:cyanophycin synthetase
VIGDGKSTIVELIDSQINSDPRCGEDESFPLEPIRVEREPAVQCWNSSARASRRTRSRPPARRSSSSATATSPTTSPTRCTRTWRTPPLAARVVGLDIAGIDIVAEDISRPLEEQRGAIVEVNAGPGLLMHLKPAKGKPRPVGAAIVDSLFPAGDKGRIPTVGVTGCKGTTLTARLVSWLVQLTGRHVGLACRDGLLLDKRVVDKRDSANWAAGQRLLINRSVDAAVFENGAATILGEGIAYDRCQVGIVTDCADAEGLGEFDIHTTDQLYHVLRTQVDIVLPEGTAVLNAADPQVARMAELCDGDVIFYGLAQDLPAIAEHRRKGGRALYLRENRIMLASGSVEGPFMELPVFVMNKDAIDGERAACLLAAVGAAVALDIPVDKIRVGIDTFEREHKRPPRSRPRRVANQ